MRHTLIAIPDKCTGCHRCEMWCSMTRKGVINIERAAIHVLRREPSIDTPLVCLQCGVCIRACPHGAIKRNRETGAVVIDTDRCDLCGTCMLSCPYGMISLDPIDRHAVKCDLCGGEPECVKHCPEGALLFVAGDQAARHRREGTARSHRKEGRRYLLDTAKLG